MLAPTPIPRSNRPGSLRKPVSTHSGSIDKIMLQVKRGSFVGVGKEFSLLSLLQRNWRGAPLRYSFILSLSASSLSLGDKDSVWPVVWMNEGENGVLLKMFVFMVLM